MASFLEQIDQYKAEAARATAELSRFKDQADFAALGNVPATLSEFNHRGEEVARLSAELASIRAQIPGGDLTALLAEHANRSQEITRLTSDLRSLTEQAQGHQRTVAELQDGMAEQVEMRAAELVSGVGMMPPAKSDPSPSHGGKTPANQRTREEHWEHYGTLGATEKNAYYRAHKSAMDSY